LAKKGGKSKGFISKGIHSNVSRKITNAMRSEYLQSGDRILNQMKALRQGKDIVLTVANPNKEQTNKKFIKVRVSGKEYIQRLKDNSRIQKTVEA
jgi:CRISPR/Cas system type I-B associated protein Csh2 (Cas7 group RAMP superfamily)